MQLTMPSEPAMAVSTAMRILRSETHPFPPSREGDAESVAIFLFIDITLGLEINTSVNLPTPQVLPIEGEIPEGRGGLPYFIASLEMRCSLKPFATSFLRFTSGRNTMRWLLICAEGEKSSALSISLG